MKIKLGGIKMKSIIIILSLLFCYVNIYSQTANDFYQTGLRLYDENNFSAAINYFNKAIEYYPKDSYKEKALVYWPMTKCYFSLKDYDNSLIACHKWIETGFWKGDAYKYLGLIYELLKEYQSSLYAYTLAIENSNDVYINDNHEQFVYKSIKYVYRELKNEYGWVPKSQLWRVNIQRSQWNSIQKGNYKCISKFLVTVTNNLPITIQAVNINLIIFDDRDNIVYKKNHTAWVKNLAPGEVTASSYFDLDNEVCLPIKYINGDHFKWNTEVTGIAY